jgi:hypothetical protein
MAGEKKRWWIWGVRTAVAAVGLAALLIGSGEPTQRAVLPDGSVMALHKIETNRLIWQYYGNAWERAAARYLPPRINKAFGIRAFKFPLTNDSAAALVQLDVSAVGGLGAVMLRHDSPGVPYASFPTGLLISDDVGNAFDPQWWGTTILGTSNEFRLVYSVPLVSHLVKEYRISVYHAEAEKPMKVLADFKSEHPLRGSKPAWPATTLPQTNRVGTITVILSKLTTLPTVTNSWTANSTSAFQTRAYVWIPENASQNNAWKVERVTVLDEEGNYFPRFPFNSYYSWSDEGITFPGLYSPLETRKFRFTLRRPGGQTLEVDFLARPEAEGGR